MPIKNKIHIFLSYLLACLFLLLPAVLGSCARPIQEEPDARLVFAVSIPPQKAFIKAVCADLAEVLVLVPPGNSPANFEPDAKTMQKLASADLYFSIGVATEAANILPRLGDLEVYDLAGAVAAKLPDRRLVSGSRDPHIWLSVARVRLIIQTIADQASRLDPANQTSYAANARDYLEQLDQLAVELDRLLLPQAGKTVFVYHPSFGYLTDDYGLTMLALEQDGKEATAQHLQQMVDLALAKGIDTIFSQAEIDSRQSRAFAEQVGARVLVLDPLAEDYLENMLVLAQELARGAR